MSKTTFLIEVREKIKSLKMERLIQLSTFFPPRIEDVKIYFSQRGLSEQEAECFFLFYEKKGWMSKNGNFLKNWKNTAYQWILCILKEEPWHFDKVIH
jgi:hypothetical protein